MYPAMSALACPGVQSITRLAGRDVGRHSACLMNLLRLSATQCPVGLQCRQLIEVLQLSRGPSMTLPLCHLLLNTLSILFVLSVVLHVSMAYMADAMTIDVYRRIFVFLLIFFTSTLGEVIRTHEAFPIRVYMS